MFKDLSISYKGLLNVVALLTCLVSVATFFDGVSRYFELFTHFKLVYFTMSLVCMVLFLAMRCHVQVFIMLFVAVIHFVSIAPWYYADENRIAAENQETIKVLHSNLLSSNQNYSLLAKLLDEESPTIVVLQEVNIRWLSQLATVLSSYKYTIEKPQRDNFGIAVFSRIPLDEANVISLGNLGVPSIEVTFSLQSESVKLIATHPVPPTSDIYYGARNEQLTRVAKHISLHTGPKLIIGDLNVSMWSSDYVKFEALSGLTNARKGWGVMPTWPTQLPFLMIPIDHILISEHFAVNHFKTGNDIGSDHLPLVIELSLVNDK